MKNNILVIAVLINCFATQSLTSQSTSTVLEGVILFNSEAYKVRMTPKGKIIAFLSDVDNNYTSLNKQIPKSIELDRNEVDNAVDLARVNGNTLDPKELAATLAASYSKQSNDVDANQDKMNTTDLNERDLAVTDVTPPDEMTTKGELEEIASKTNYDYEFAFDHRDATLSPSSVNQLNTIAEMMTENTSSMLEINSYYSETVDISKILSKNRAKGISDMLVSKGIERSRISISESNNEDWANNRVKVSIH